MLIPTLSEVSVMALSLGPALANSILIPSLKPTLGFQATEQLYAWACVAVHKLLKAKQKLKKLQLLPPGWANAPTDRGEGSYPPVLQRGGKALKLSSSHSPPKRLSPGGHL